MKNLLLVLVVIFHLKTLSQPSGKLYLHSVSSSPHEKGILGYIGFPGSPQVFNAIDSVDLFDFVISGDTLYTAGNTIYFYNLQSNLVSDSINERAIRIQKWNNQLITLSDTPPYFKAFDLSTHSQVFILDSTKVPSLPNDMLVTDNKAFLLLPDSIIVVDLLQQDTITKIFTPHPYLFPGINAHLVEKDSLLYVDVAYFTGAPRFSFIKINKYDYSVTSVFHYEGAESFVRPVIAGDSIYMLNYNTFYDIQQDSLFLSSLATDITVEYDSISRSIFLYRNSSHLISWVENGLITASAVIPNFLTKAAFRTDYLNATSKIFNSDTPLYSNPVQSQVKIEFQKEVYLMKYSITDNSGKMTSHVNIKRFEKTLYIDTGSLPAGFYTFTIFTETGSFPLKIVVM